MAVSSHIIKTLTEREWIKVVGQRDVPGRPSLYATTRQFLDYFNLKSLDQLPTLSEIRDIDEINSALDLGEVDDAAETAPETSDDGDSGQDEERNQAAAEQSYPASAETASAGSEDGPDGESEETELAGIGTGASIADTPDGDIPDQPVNAVPAASPAEHPDGDEAFASIANPATDERSV